jgi:hypothetical protein
MKVILQNMLCTLSYISMFLFKQGSLRYIFMFLFKQESLSYISMFLFKQGSLSYIFMFLLKQGCTNASFNSYTSCAGSLWPWSYIYAFSCEFNLFTLKGVLHTTLCDNFSLICRWLSSISSTVYDITEILFLSKTFYLFLFFLIWPLTHFNQCHIHIKRGPRLFHLWGPSKFPTFMNGGR